jgi:hypothetical protein
VTRIDHGAHYVVVCRSFGAGWRIWSLRADVDDNGALDRDCRASVDECGYWDRVRAGVGV